MGLVSYFEIQRSATRGLVSSCELEVKIFPQVLRQEVSNSSFTVIFHFVKSGGGGIPDTTFSNWFIFDVRLQTEMNVCLNMQ